MTLIYRPLLEFQEEKEFVHHASKVQLNVGGSISDKVFFGQYFLQAGDLPGDL